MKTDYEKDLKHMTYVGYVSVFLFFGFLFFCAWIVAKALGVL